MNEERILYFNVFKARLSYNEDGSIDMLRLEHNNGTEIVIRSLSVLIAPEKIYELLKECDVSWRS